MPTSWKNLLTRLAESHPSDAAALQRASEFAESERDVRLALTTLGWSAEQIDAAIASIGPSDPPDPGIASKKPVE